MSPARRAQPDIASWASRPATSGVDPLTGATETQLVGERFEPRGEIGVGGMGQVAIVFDRWLGREIALKRPATAADEARLLREASITAGLEHPGIVAIYDAGRDDGPWFAMRLVRGRSLAQAVGDHERPDALLRHVLDVANALAYAHARGVVHRDLKAANVMIGAFGETQVIDWGLALAPDLPSPDLGRAGTPAAMAPEQARGEVIDARADVYALGAILREVVTRRPLFDPALTSEGILGALAADRVPALGSDLAPELAAIIRRAMAPRAADRYADASGFADDMARYLDGRRVLAHQYNALELLKRLVRAWRVPLVIAGVGLVVLAIVLVVAFKRVADERDRSEDHLASTLVMAARSALEQDLRGPAEVLARAALDRAPIEARGVLMALPEQRPTREHLADLPCTPADIDPVGLRVLCRTPSTIEVRTVTGASWSISMASDGAMFVADAVLVFHHRDQVDSFRAVDGVALGTRAAWCTGGRLDPVLGGRAGLGVGGSCAVRQRVDGEDPIPTGLCEGSRIRGAALSQDAERWALACTDGAVVVGRFGDGLGIRFETHFPTTPNPRMPTVIAFEGHDRVLVGNDSGELIGVDLGAADTGFALRTLEVGRGLVRDIAVSPDGALAVVTLDSESPMVVDLGRWTMLGRIPLTQVTPRPRIAFERDAILLAHSVFDRWRFAGGRARSMKLDGGVSALAVSRDGRHLAAASGNTLRVIDSDERRVVSTQRWQSDLVRSAAFGNDGALVADGMGTPELARFASITAPPQVEARLLRTLGVLADGALLGVDYSQRVTHIARHTTRIEGVPGADLSVSADGRNAIVLGWDHALYRARDFTLERGFGRFALDLEAIDVCVDDSEDAYTISADAIRQWLTDGSEGPRIAVPGADLVVITSAADLIAAGAKDGAVRVWRKGETTPRAILREHRARADTLVIEPRGRWLVSGGWDGELHFVRRPDEVGAQTVSELEARWGLTLADLIGPR